MDPNTPDRLDPESVPHFDYSQMDDRAFISFQLAEQRLTIMDIRDVLGKINPNDIDQSSLLLVIIDEDQPYKLHASDFSVFVEKIDPNTLSGSHAAVMLESEGLIAPEALAALRGKVDVAAINVREGTGEYGSVLANLVDAGLLQLTVPKRPLRTPQEVCEDRASLN